MSNSASQNSQTGSAGLNELIQLVEQHKNLALSDSDLLDLMKNQANVVTYKDIKKYGTIDSLLGPYNVCFILYEWKPSYGHWTLLSRAGDLLEFFDPYGNFPDSQLALIPEPWKTESGQNVKRLSKLMIECNYDLSYNEYPFQKHHEDTKTCGRWCVVRALLKDLPLEDFKSLFLSKDSDTFATILTS